MNKYNFRDYNPDGLWNDDYAIEAEVGSQFYNDELYQFKFYEETDAIFELLDMHRETSSNRELAYNLINQEYNSGFPIGEDSCVSGGTHFHIFNGDYKGLNAGTLKYKLLNCPLHCKINNKTLYSRRLDRWCSFDNDYIETNDKGYFVCYKDSYYTHNHDDYAYVDSGTESIEFRCNNVFDRRLYGYYIAVMIASKEGIKLKKLSDSTRKYARVGDSGSYEHDDDGTYLGVGEMYGCDLGEDDFKKMNINIQILVDVLLKNNLCKAADALVEYVNENGFDVKAKCVLQDCLTGEQIQQGYILKDLCLNSNVYELLIFKTKSNCYQFVKDKLEKDLDSAGLHFNYGIDMKSIKTLCNSKMNARSKSLFELLKD